jgi:hypothetical protein
LQYVHTSDTLWVSASPVDLPAPETLMSTSHTVHNWRQADEKARELANGLPVFCGTGSPIDRPHVVKTTLDALSGEGTGYHVWIYPEGDGCGSPVEHHTIAIH